VWRYIPGARPSTVAEMAANIEGKLREGLGGTRTPWVQKDARTGAVIGTTSYCPPDEANRGVHIGSTQLARAYWRSGVNTEAKLLLMTHAFETLGAGRVELQTDCRNLRSQAAIERIGGRREGIFRRHKQRGDGSWRDSYFYAITVDEWPEARNRLAERLARG
jgi:RimJ/RimL family protein N-acetyltransferase